jgi:hypothetical protein
MADDAVERRAIVAVVPQLVKTKQRQKERQQKLLQCPQQSPSNGPIIIILLPAAVARSMTTASLLRGMWVRQRN